MVCVLFSCLVLGSTDVHTIAFFLEVLLGAGGRQDRTTTRILTILLHVCFYEYLLA